MARQRGVFKVSGRLDDFAFSHGPEGLNVGMSRFISRDRILNDDAFKRTRENMIAFGGMATMTKAIRNPLAIMLKGFTDRTTNPRLGKEIRKGFKAGPGARNRQDFLVVSNGQFLKDFEINGISKFSSTMIAPHTVTVNAARNQADLNVPVFNPDNLSSPNGATHFVLYLAAFALSDYAFDPDAGIYIPVNPALSSESIVVQTLEIPLNTPLAAPLTLSAPLPSAPVMPATAGLMVLTGIRFLQEVNSVFYTFSAGDCMRIQGIY